MQNSIHNDSGEHAHVTEEGSKERIQHNGNSQQAYNAEQSLGKSTHKTSKSSKTLIVFFIVLGSFTITWGAVNVGITMLVDSSNHWAFQPSSDVVHYLYSLVNDDFPLFWLVAIILLLLLAFLASCLVTCYSTDWNPWTNTARKVAPIQACRMEVSTVPHGSPSRKIELLDRELYNRKWYVILKDFGSLATVSTFMSTILCFGSVMTGCYCVILTLLLHYEFAYSSARPRLPWSQYQKLNYWCTSAVLLVGVFPPSATFTSYMLTRGRVTMTGTISLVFKCVKIKEDTSTGSVYWCIGKHFIVRERHCRWAVAIAFWFIVWFLLGTFVMLFQVVAMSQTQLALAPNCDDLKSHDCFRFNPHITPILNCSQIENNGLITCVKVGDGSFSGTTFSNATGVAVALVSFCLAMINLSFNKLFPFLCPSDKWRVRLGRSILYMVVPCLLLAFIVLLALDSNKIFICYFSNRMRLILFTLLMAAIALVLLKSENGTSPVDLPVHHGEDISSKRKCIIVATAGIILYFVPILLAVVDRTVQT